MYDVIFNPSKTDVNEHGETLNPLVVYFKSKGKFYATEHVDIVIGSKQYIPSPNDDEIHVTPNPSEGEDIDIDLEVCGPEGGVKIRPGTLKKEIMKGEAAAGQALSKAAIQAMIGNREFNVNISVNRDGAPVGGNSGTITSNSDIEIE